MIVGAESADISSMRWPAFAATSCSFSLGSNTSGWVLSLGDSPQLEVFVIRGADAIKEEDGFVSSWHKPPASSSSLKAEK